MGGREPPQGVGSREVTHGVRRGDHEGAKIRGGRQRKANGEKAVAEEYQVGIDIGGTFTDVVILNLASGRLFLGKRLTSPDNPARAVTEVIREMLERDGIAPSRVGTSVAATAVLEEVAGRRLDFAVAARDGSRLVARGRVTRAVVDRASFLERAGA